MCVRAWRLLPAVLLSACMVPGRTAGPGAEVRTIRALIDAGRYAEAERSARRLLDGRERAAALDLLAETLCREGKAGEARPDAEEALAMRESALGRDHPDVATSLTTLALIARAQENYEEMRRLHERALRIRERRLGPEDPDTALSLNGIAVAHRIAGDYPRARTLYERALAILERTRGPDHPDTLRVLDNLGEVRRTMGDPQGARPLLERALAGREKALGPDHLVVAESCRSLASLAYGDGDFAEARRLGERVLAIDRRVLPPTHPQIAADLGGLADALKELRGYEGAIRLLEEGRAIAERDGAGRRTDLASLLQDLAVLYRLRGDRGRATALTRRALAIRREVVPPDHRSSAPGPWFSTRWRRGTGLRATALTPRPPR